MNGLAQTGSIAIGSGSLAQGDFTDPYNYASAVTIGLNSAATADGTIALGEGAQAQRYYAQALGAYSLASGAGSFAGGGGSQATADGAIAIGGATSVNSDFGPSGFATASGISAIGVGTNAVATGAYATAIGSNATSQADEGVAVGHNASAISSGDVAIGPGASATGTPQVGSAVSIGAGNQAIGAGAVAIGDPSVANGQGAFAGGFNSIATADGTATGGAANGAVAIGNMTIAVGQGSVALGNQTQANSAGSVALGDTAVVSFGSANGVAIGSGSLARYSGSVAIGSGAATGVAAPTGNGYATGSVAPGSEISVGSANNERRITNVSAGSAGTDAVNVSQLNQVAQTAASALGAGAAYDPATGAYKSPNYTVGGVTSQNVGTAIAAESSIVANQGSMLATLLGGGTTYNAASGTFSGGSFKAGANGATYSTVADALAGISGNGAGSDPDAVHYSDTTHSSVTLGSSAAAPVTVSNVANGSVASGSHDAVNGSQLYVTNQATAASQSIANNALAVGQNSVQYSDATHSSIILGNVAAAPVTVSNVANGSVASVSHDAVNGSQLYATNQATAAAQSTANSALALGQSSLQYSDATHSSVILGNIAAAPVTVSNVANGSVASVSHDAVNGSQLYATNQATAAAQSTANSALALGQSSLQYDDPSHSSVTLDNGGAPATLHNVGPAVSANDAVNLNQLQSAMTGTLNSANAYTNAQISAIRFDLNAVRRDVSSGDARTAALSGIPQAYDSGQGMVGMAMGGSGGAVAIAIGASKAFSDHHTVVKGGVSYVPSGGYNNQVTWQVGAGYAF